MKHPFTFLNHKHHSTVDTRKRRSLKIISGSAAFAGAVTSGLASHGASATETLSDHATSAIAIESSGGQNTGQVSINIMVNKSMVYDWILMENLSDQPINVEIFSPGFITYLGKQLDLNQLVSSNANNGSLQLHNDYAWSQSLYGVPSSPIAPHSQLLKADDVVEAISADTRLVRCWAHVAQGQAKLFTGDPPRSIA